MVVAKSKRKSKRRIAFDPVMPYEDAVEYLSAVTGAPEEAIDESKGKFFNWWFRIPYPVQEKPADLNKFERMSDEEFWPIVDAINWKKSAKSGISTKTKKFLAALSNNDRLRLYNAYAIRLQMLYMVLNCYVIATSDPSGTSDDSTWDLLSEVIGRGEEFFVNCMADPKLISNMGKKGTYTENFGYILYPEDSDSSELAPALIGIYAEDGSHPAYSSWLVRYFQLIYGTV